MVIRNRTPRKAVYLDYSATTPVDPRVAQKMSGCLLADGDFGNPASTSHVYGWNASELVEAARQQVAELVNGDPRAVVWTSGATESDNLALKGVFEAVEGGHLVGPGSTAQSQTCWFNLRYSSRASAAQRWPAGFQ